MKSWRARVVCEGEGFRPRQFEYSPHVPNRLVFGTIRGEVVVCELPSASAASSSSSTKDTTDRRGGNGEAMEVEEGNAGGEEGTKILKRLVGKTKGTRLAKDMNDAILGLSWLRKHPSKFIVGSASGVLHLCDMDKEEGEEGGAVVRGYEQVRRVREREGRREGGRKEVDADLDSLSLDTPTQPRHMHTFPSSRASPPSMATARTPASLSGKEKKKEGEEQ